jgi:hypothetical protein
MIETVYLDMDGVLVNFVRPALALIRPGAVGSIMKTWPPGLYDLPTVAEIQPEKFWARVDDQPAEWWARLPATSWADDLTRLVDRWPITIASKPRELASMVSTVGKIAWLVGHYGNPPPPYVFPDDKAACLLDGKPAAVRQGSLLIDDSDAEIEAWRARGGPAILFPAIWNSNYRHSLRPLDFVRDELTQMEKP